MVRLTKSGLSYREAPSLSQHMNIKLPDYFPVTLVQYNHNGTGIYGYDICTGTSTVIKKTAVCRYASCLPSLSVLYRYITLYYTVIMTHRKLPESHRLASEKPPAGTIDRTAMDSHCHIHFYGPNCTDFFI